MRGPPQKLLFDLSINDEGSHASLPEINLQTSAKSDLSTTPRTPPPPPGPGRGHKKDRNTLILSRWNEPGPLGFWAWVEDVKPRVIGHDSKYHAWEPTVKQREAVNDILSADDQDRFIHSMSLLIEPRRHGKSTVFALIVLWLTTSRENHVTQLLGNTLDHARRVQFRTLKRIIANTPKLSLMIPEANILSHEINYAPLQSSIQLGEGVSQATAFGDRLNLLWVSDLHAAPTLEAFNALQAALLDSQDSLCLIDSNVDVTDGHVHALQREAGQDEGIYARHISYKDLTEFEALAPPWIDRLKARRLERTSLEADFKRDVLGQRSDAKNALFPAAVINKCKSKYKTPVSDIQELVKGRAYKIGGGLDRSKSLIGGDNTVWTVVLKVASPEHGEPEFFLLNQVVFTVNTANAIKKQILEDHERFGGLDNVTLENYEVADIGPWLNDQRIPYELVSAHDTNQNASFPEFQRIAKEGRLHFPAGMKGLAKEMSTFVYIQRTGGKYSFGHSSQRFKDDRVYSLNWAIFSLREAVLHSYVLGNIQCLNRSKRRGLCYLMGGGLQMLCSEGCHAHNEVEAMFREFRKLRMDEDIMIPEFFDSYVKFEGARISQAA